MKPLREFFNDWLSIAAIVAGSVLLIGLEILEEPDLSLGEILVEMIQPTLIVIVAVGMVRLTDRMARQQEKQQLMSREGSSDKSFSNMAGRLIAR